jgi:chromosome segregation ATPase
MPTDAPDKGNNGSSTSSLLPWVRRRKSIEQLREGYERVLELMDAMSRHFEKQDQRAAELSAGVLRVAQTLEQLADAQRTQSQHMASIAGRVDDAVKQSASLATMLREMPPSLQAQAEAVRGVARQMQTATAIDEQLLTSLRQLSEATDSLRASGTAQVETLRQLHDSGRQQQQSLRASVQSQTRLLFIITIIVAVLGLGIVGALALVARLVFSQ